MITVNENVLNVRHKPCKALEKKSVAQLFVSAHLYCHLAAKSVPTGDGVPAQGIEEEVGFNVTKNLTHRKRC